MTANAALITTIYDGYTRLDLAALLELIHPEFEIRQTELLPWGGHYHGPQGVTSFFGKLTSHIHSELEVEEFVEAGDQVVAIGRLHGHVNSTGKTFNLRFVHVWTVESGKVRRFDPYIDTPGMLQALES